MDDKKINQLFEQSTRAAHVHRDVINKSNQQLSEVKSSLNDLSETNNIQDKALNDLLKQAENLLHGINTQDTDHLKLTPLVVPEFDPLESIPETDWDSYINHIDSYIEENQLTLGEDPLHSLMTENERLDFYKKVDEDYKMAAANCDKFDYMIAAFSGVVTGLIDAFFVGAPDDSKLGKWTDKQTDNIVVKFSQTVWSFDKKNGAKLRKKPDNIASAIGYLERRFHINYDARFKSDLIDAKNLNMSAKNHHLKSLGHSPDIVGLFFSILDQFTGKSSFISDGEILRYIPVDQNKQFELQGSNLISKIYAGVTNWFGHLMSDIAGSSGVRGHNDGRRGSGLPIPFYNMLQKFNFGSISSDSGNLTIAQFSAKIFEKGYEARHGAAMAIPVTINELIIRFFWSMKQRFYHERTLKESLPVGYNPELQRMLLVGHGTLCLVDGIDALIRSNGIPMLFATRLNLVAWGRFGFAAFLEIRRIYCDNTYDLNAMTKDADQEWERLFKSY